MSSLLHVCVKILEKFQILNKHSLKIKEQREKCSHFQLTFQPLNRIRRQVDAERVEKHQLIKTYDKFNSAQVNNQLNDSVDVNDKYEVFDKDLITISKLQTSSSDIISPQIRLKIPALALTCSRTGISNGSAAI